MSSSRTYSRPSGEKGSEVTLVVRADQEVQHGRVVNVMDLARTEGLHRLAIATVK